jgi:hypothetical protein
VGLRVGIEDEALGRSYLKTDVSPRERERGKAQKGLIKREPEGIRKASWTYKGDAPVGQD